MKEEVICINNQIGSDSFSFHEVMDKIMIITGNEEMS